MTQSSSRGAGQGPGQPPDGIGPDGSPGRPDGEAPRPASRVLPPRPAVTFLTPITSARVCGPLGLRSGNCMLSQGHCRDRGVTSSLTKTSKHRAVCLSRCPGPRDPASGDPSARTRHARLGKVRAPACAPRRCSQRPGCGRSLGARPRGRRRGCPCTVDRSSAVREDAMSPSVRTWTGLEGRHPGLSPTAEFPLLHKGVAASGRVTWQGLASRQTGNSQDEAAGYHGRREKPTGHGDADSLRRDGSGPRPCSAPVCLLGCPGLGAPTRRAGSPERAWPEGTGPCRQGDGCPPVPAPVVGRCVPIPPLVPPSRRLCSLVL